MNKQELVKQIIDVYGEGFKNPLARDLGVHRDTVRRWINSDEELQKIHEYAVRYVLEGKKHGEYSKEMESLWFS